MVAFLVSFWGLSLCEWHCVLQNNWIWRSSDCRKKASVMNRSLTGGNLKRIGRCVLLALKPTVFEPNPRKPQTTRKILICYTSIQNCNITKKGGWRLGQFGFLRFCIYKCLGHQVIAKCWCWRTLSHGTSWVHEENCRLSMGDHHGCEMPNTSLKALSRARKDLNVFDLGP